MNIEKIRHGFSGLFSENYLLLIQQFSLVSTESAVKINFNIHITSLILMEHPLINT